MFCNQHGKFLPSLSSKSLDYRMHILAGTWLLSPEILPVQPSHLIHLLRTLTLLYLGFFLKEIISYLRGSVSGLEIWMGWGGRRGRPARGRCPLLCKPTFISRLPLPTPLPSLEPPAGFGLYAGFRGHSLPSLSLSSSLLLLFLLFLATALPPFCPCDLELAEGNHSRAASLLQAAIVCAYLNFSDACTCVCFSFLYMCETDNTIKAGWEKNKRVTVWQMWRDSLLDWLTSATFGGKTAENKVGVQKIWSRQKTGLHAIKHRRWPLHVHPGVSYACENAFECTCQHAQQLWSS